EEAAAVVLADPVGDLDDQASAATDHERRRAVAGDDVGLDRLPEQREPVLERVLPERHRPLGERIGTPDVVDEDVELPVFALDARQQLVDLAWVAVGARERERGSRGRPHLVGLAWVAVVDRDGDAVSAGGTDQLGGLLDRLRPVHRRPPSSGGAPADGGGRARGAELGGDAAPSAPRASGNQRDLIHKRLSHGRAYNRTFGYMSSGFMTARSCILWLCPARRPWPTTPYSMPRCA